MYTAGLSQGTRCSNMLNPTLDHDDLARQYAADQRLRINDFLEADIARRFQNSCRDDVPYEYLYHVEGKHLAVPPAELAQLAPDKQNELQNKIIAAAAKGVGFFYSGYQLTNAHLDTDNKELAFLREMFDLMNSDEVLALISTITGQTDLKGADAQVTRYTPGQFLTRHSDDVTREGRRIAYVLGFSEEWHPDWGGLLQFFENDGTPRDAWIPAFNSLSLFDVRHVHSVTYVTPFALKPRLSLTGWFIA